MAYDHLSPTGILIFFSQRPKHKFTRIHHIHTSAPLSHLGFLFLKIFIYCSVRDSLPTQEHSHCLHLTVGAFRVRKNLFPPIPICNNSS
uniref:Uncharacterized protein n=1 Tax=Manihot esculenta TaxID=3983 RepID=A0A2C9U9W5_MANES